MRAMETLLHVIDDIGDILACYALDYRGDAKYRLVALQAKLASDEHYGRLVQPGLRAAVEKAYSDQAAGDRPAAISALSRLSRQLWQRYWKDNEAH